MRATAPLLLIDAGNSRLKWALCFAESTTLATDGIKFRRRGALELSELRRSRKPLQAILASVPERTRILACNVAGASIEQSVRTAASRLGLPRPHFVRTSARAAGVRNGYADPWRLGADRWVALIGAHAAWPAQALCLVGIGSALTIDLLGPDGHHRGGCIAPGPQMMIESLLRETAGIRRRAQLGNAAAIARALVRKPASAGRAGRSRSPMFATATREALLAGARQACAALIDRAAQQATDQLRTPVPVVLSGGGAASIEALLQRPCRREEDLVLRGLAALARAGQPIA
jgi:type III pantothenate kinase